MRCPKCQRRNPDNYLYCARCGAPLGTAGGEWRFATVVFFDLSDYTRLTRERGAEIAWQEAERAFSIARERIEAEGGQIHKVYGDGLLAVFGLGKSRGAEAERALSAAATIVERVEREHREGRLRLRGRAAVASGLILAMPTLATEELFGDPLNRAQRLVALTPPGSVYLDETTRTLVTHAECEPLPPLAAKGFPEPLKAFRFAGFSRPGAKIPEDELLDELEHAWNEVRAGRGRVAVLVGPPGAGKRFLVEAFLTRHRSHRVLRLPPLTREGSLRGWLRRFLERAPEVKRRIGKLSLPPEIRRPVEIALGLRPGRVPDEEALEAIAEVLRRFDAHPWILVIEGVHRAPPLLRQFLEHWHGREGHVLILATARSGRYPLALALSRLQPDEAERWLARRFPASDPEARRRAAELGDGLPGLMAALLPEPREERLLAALQPHFDALKEAREVLFLAAILKDPIPPDYPPAVFGPRATEALAQLEAEGFLKRGDGGYVFTSEAYRRAAAASVPRAKRRVWLRALADALLSRGEGEAAVRCYLRAERKGTAIRVLRSLARNAPDAKAIALLNQALALAENPAQAMPVRLDLAERLLSTAPERALALLADLSGPRALKLRGLALAARGQHEDALRDLEAYLETRPEDGEVWSRYLELVPLTRLAELEPPPLPAVLTIKARRLKSAGLLEAAGRTYARALAASRGEAAAQIALVLAGLAWRRYRPRDARTYAEKALAETRDPATATLSRAILGSLELDVGNLAAAEAEIGKALETLDDLPCSEAYARVAGIELRLLVETGRIAEARRRAAHHLARCPHPWIGALDTLVRALAGEAREALAQAERLSGGADSPHTEGFLWLARGVAISRLRGDPRSAYRRALRFSTRGQNPYLRFLALAAFALHYRPQEPEKTKAIADRMLRQTWRQGFLPFHHLARLLKAEAARAAGRRVAPLLRFESPFPVLEYWRRSLLLSEGREVEPIPEERLLGYGILGRLALASWKRVWTRARRSVHESV